MNSILLIGILIIVLLAVTTAFKSKGFQEFPYERTEYLLSEAERSFYGVLVQAVGNNKLIFPKVRVADVLSPVRGPGRSRRQIAFNRISSKHFDFVICHPEDLSVLMAVELDDSSHGNKSRFKRDRFLNEACRSSKLPLLRIKAARGYGIENIKESVEQLLALSSLPAPTELQSVQEGSGKKDESAGSSGMNSIKDVVYVEQKDENSTASEIPLCPMCGTEMVLRVAKTGKNAGRKFWGCSSFPKCKIIQNYVSQNLI